MDEVPGFRALMRSFYAASLGALAPRDALDDVERHAALVEAVLAPLDPRDGALLVDVGTGAGLLALAAAKRVPRARVLGVDLATEALGRAADAARAAGLGNVRFEEGDAEAMPVADGEADAVLAISAFNLFPAKRAFLAEARRALVPEGTLLVAEAFRVEDAPFEEGPGPLALGPFHTLLRAGGFEPTGGEDVTELRRALDVSKAWRYHALVDGFEFRVEVARRVT